MIEDEVFDTVDELRNLVVQNGINFLQSLYEYYGSDKGLELWESFGEVFGNEIKGQVLFSMLTKSSGAAFHTVSFTSVGVAQKAVPIIKAIRSVTDLSLKDAKEIYDISQWKYARFPVDTKLVKNIKQELTSYGCVIA